MLNPSTPVVALEEIAGDVDFVLVMSVNPGFGGQTFIPRSESKVREVRALLDRAGNPAPIEIDGGIDLHNVARVVAAGARILVAGSADLPRAGSRARHARAEGGRARAPLGAAGRRVERSPAPRPACACATPKPTRWASSTTRTTSSGSRSAAPICCATPGWSYREMEAEGFALPVIEAHCDYRQPARYDDELEVRTTGDAAVAGPRAVRLRGRAARRRRDARDRAHRPRVARSRTAGRAGCPSACGTLFA